jgi:predicted neutral ceramidase superfamily lipid hydrolase
MIVILIQKLRKNWRQFARALGESPVMAKFAIVQIFAVTILLLCSLLFQKPLALVFWLPFYITLMSITVVIRELGSNPLNVTAYMLLIDSVGFIPVAFIGARIMRPTGRTNRVAALTFVMAWICDVAAFRIIRLIQADQPVSISSFELVAAIESFSSCLAIAIAWHVLANWRKIWPEAKVLRADSASANN